MASNARFASSPPAASASVSTRGVICQETPPLVLAPAARTLLTSIADDGVPVAVGLLLIIGGDLKRKSFVMLERGTAVEAKTRDAGNREFHRQHVALLAGGVVTGGTVDGAHGAVGKGFGVEAGSSLGVLVVPQANRVLGHCLSLSLPLPNPDVSLRLALLRLRQTSRLQEIASELGHD